MVQCSWSCYVRNIGYYAKIDLISGSGACPCSLQLIIEPRIDQVNDYIVWSTFGPLGRLVTLYDIVGEFFVIYHYKLFYVTYYKLFYITHYESSSGCSRNIGTVLITCKLIYEKATIYIWHWFSLYKMYHYKLFYVTHYKLFYITQILIGYLRRRVVWWTMVSLLLLISVWIGLAGMSTTRNSILAIFVSSSYT